METSHLKNWRTVMLLSIIVPAGLLTTFKLTGIFRSPVTIAKTTTLEVLNWNFTAPSKYEYVDIIENLSSAYVGDGLRVDQSLIPWDYVPVYIGLFSSGPYLDLGMRINATMANEGGFIESFRVAFEDFQPSRLALLLGEFERVHLSLVNYKDGGDEGYINLVGVNTPSNAYFNSSLFLWILTVPNTQEYHMKITFEVVCYNGTAFNKLIQPFDLRVSRPEA